MHNIFRCFSAISFENIIVQFVSSIFDFPVSFLPRAPNFAKWSLLGEKNYDEKFLEILEDPKKCGSPSLAYPGASGKNIICNLEKFYIEFETLDIPDGVSQKIIMNIL